MTNESGDAVSFSPGPAAGFGQNPVWKILVVDDDPLMHEITRLSLGDLVFRGRPVLCLAALSRNEAEALLRQQADVALVLLDVVIEQSGGGLELVQFIRETLQNQSMRIVLRTGLLDPAPERNLVLDYDIDGYWSKADLTDDRLRNAVIASLRTFDLLRSLDRYRIGLEAIVGLADELLQSSAVSLFLDRTLVQLARLVGIGQDAFVLVPDGMDGMVVATGVGAFGDAIGRRLEELPLDSAAMADAVAACRDRGNRFSQSQAVVVMPTDDRNHIVLRVGIDRQLDAVESALLRLFIEKVASCFQAVQRTERLEFANHELTVLTANLERRVSERTAELERLAMIDPLTETANRRYFYARAATELAGARRTGRTLSLAILDLDHFKRVNDTYGHIAGDAVLRHAAATSASALRAADLLGRFGGEEFAVLLPETPLVEAGMVAERIREKLAAAAVEFNGKSILVTGSIGVASLATEDDSIDAVLNRADQALYRAKAAGRNRVAIAED